MTQTFRRPLSNFTGIRKSEIRPLRPRSLMKRSGFETEQRIGIMKHGFGAYT